MPGASAACARPRLPHFCLPSPAAGCALADCGANVDCKPERMEQFALMATALMQSCGVEEPRVGLLSVGVEESKGSHFIREVYDLLERLPIRFTGMMEARDALSGEYDVIVAEGFSGNVLLKTVEGTGLFTAARLRASADSAVRAAGEPLHPSWTLPQTARPCCSACQSPLPEGARQRKRSHDPECRPPAPAAGQAGLSRSACRLCSPARPSCRRPENTAKPEAPAPGFLPGEPLGLPDDSDHSPLRARIIRRWQTIRTTGGLSGIFSDVHAAGENDLTFFAACGRRTLRGFLMKRPNGS